MKKISKFLFSLIALSLLVLPAMVSAYTPTNTPSTVGPLTVDTIGVTEFNSSTSLSDRSPIKIAASLINTITGFLGIIAVVIMLVGGFKWMTAMGNDEAIKKAKGLMGAGIVGLIIVLASWGIAKFVVDALIKSANN